MGIHVMGIPIPTAALMYPVSTTVPMLVREASLFGSNVGFSQILD